MEINSNPKKEDFYLKVEYRPAFTIEELQDIERRAIGEQNDYPNIYNPKLTRAYGELGHWAGKVIKQLQKGARPDGEEISGGE